MANRYASLRSTLRARNVFEGVISPPNDLVIPGTDWAWQVLNRRRSQISPNSNLMIHSAGLFCNFADGLVLKNAYQLSQHVIRATAGARMARQAASWGSVTKNITVADSTLFGIAEFVILDRIDSIDASIPDEEVEYNLIVDIPDGTTLTVADYPLRAGAANAVAYPIHFVAADQAVYVDARELNYMYSREQFFSPLSLTTIPVTELILSAGITHFPYDFEFLTKSISTDFADDAVFFDILADVEYTERTAAELIA